MFIKVINPRFAPKWLGK